MAIDVSSNNNYWVTSASIPSEPASRTHLAWVNPDTVSGVQSVISRDANGDGSRSYQFRTSGSEIQYIHFVSGSAKVLSSTSAGLGISQWDCIVATCTDGAQEVWTGGTSRGVATESGAPDSDDSAMGIGLRIGAEATPTQFEPFNGQIAICATWDRVLDDAEIILLSQGFSPLFIQTGLFWHFDFTGREGDTTIPDSTGSVVVTERGAVGVAAGPPIIYPTRPHIVAVPGAAPPAGDNLAWALAGARPALAGRKGLAG